MTNDKEEFFRQFYQSADLEYVDYRGSNVYQIADIELKEAFKTVESKLKAKDEEIERLSKQNESFQEVYYRLITQLTNEIEGTTK